MKIKSFTRRFPIVSYFLLAYLISWGGSLAFAGPKLLRGEVLQSADGLNMALAMIAGPSLSGLAMTYLNDGRQGLRDLWSRMLRWRAGLQWYAAALLIFPVLILGLLWVLYFFVSPDFAPSFVSFGILAGLMAGFFEEIGWMGFAFPKMKTKLGIWRATIYLALLHGFWHILVSYLGDFGNYGGYWLPRFIAMWIVAMAAMRILLVWIYSNTGSMLLTQLTHASSTGFLVALGPGAISPAQETLWFVIYAVVLMVPAAVVIARYGKSFMRKPQPAAVV
ncbi:MAG: CPBP family intramembrane metalloprotease [Anaerolineales bacterium]